MKAHWTARSFKDYLFRVKADFLSQLEKKMESSNTSQGKLAKRLGKTKGRVSQVLNDPGNITLSTMIEYARKLGMKVSIIAYEDDDPENKRGPINSEVFRICWEKSGKPRDFWALQEVDISQKAATFAPSSATYAWAHFDFPYSKGWEIGQNLVYLPGCVDFVKAASGSAGIPESRIIPLAH